MKKIIYTFAFMLATMGFCNSCGNSNMSNPETVNDTTLIDSTVVDSSSIDTVRHGETVSNLTESEVVTNNGAANAAVSCCIAGAI